MFLENTRVPIIDRLTGHMHQGLNPNSQFATKMQPKALVSGSSESVARQPPSGSSG